MWICQCFHFSIFFVYFRVMFPDIYTFLKFYVSWKLKLLVLYNDLFFSVWRGPPNISCKANLMMNPFSICLSGELFISPPISNDELTEYYWLSFFLLVLWIWHANPFWAVKILQKSSDSLMFPCMQLVFVLSCCF